MQEITVKSIEKKQPKKEGGSPFYVVTADDGTEMTTFDAAIASVPQGARLGIDVKVKGKFVNIEKWTLLEKPAASARTESTEPQQFLELARQKRIDAQAQFALDQVGQALRPDLIPVERGLRDKYWLALDKMIDAYLEEKPVAVVTTTPPVTAMKPSTQKAIVEMAGKAAEQIKKETEFKNIGQVLTQALKIQPPVNPHELTQELGRELKDITDLNGAWETAQKISRQKKERGL